MTDLTAHYINKNQSEMRAIKAGWYAIEKDGNISGPSFSRGDCLKYLTPFSAGAHDAHASVRT